MNPALIGDALLAVLLIVTIIVAFRVERRLTAFRASQASLTAIVAELKRATDRAEAAIRGLKATADGAGQELDHRLKKARALADEMGMLVETAGKFSERLEASARPALQVAASRHTEASPLQGIR